MATDKGNSMERGLLLPHSSSSSSPFNNGVESSPVTFTLLLSTFVVVCASFTYGCVAGYSSPAESGIVADLGLTTAQYSVFGSILTIGGLVGALASGKLADFIGRRCTLWVSEICCCLGWLAIAFAKNVWLIDVGRLVMGFGVGLIGYVVPVYVAEMTPKNIRGALTYTSQMMMTLGFSLMYFVGTSINWRILALIGSASGFIQIVGLFFIPESPRWLEMLGREKEFEASLQRLRGITFDITEEANDIRDITAAFKQLSKARLIDLFQRRYAYSLTVGTGLMVLPVLMGTSATAYYTTEIFEAAGFSTNVGSKTMAVLQIPFSIFGIFIIDKYGRRILLLVSIAGMGLSYCLIGASFLLQDFGVWTKITPILVFVGLLGSNSSYSIGIGGIPWIIISEIFPITVKGTAGSLMSSAYWLSAWITTYTFSFMLDWSSAGTFFIFAAIGGLTYIFVAKVVPETKGRTLEEIQASMSHLLSKSPGELLNWEDLHEMKYSWNVACEAMRLAPPIQGGFRQAMTDFVYSGFSIPRGWKLYWSTSSTHLNPECFPEPEKFDPTRFDGIGPAPYTFIPFGGGPKICPGQVYA